MAPHGLLPVFGGENVPQSDTTTTELQDDSTNTPEVVNDPDRYLAGAEIQQSDNTRQPWSFP